MPARGDRLIHCFRRIASRAAPDPAADSVLLTRFLAGHDTAAFEALVGRHGPMVLRVCRRVLGNRQDAEDAFQATFLVLARKAASVQPPEALAAWLHGVACRVALEARPAARRRTREALAPDLAPADPRPDPLSELTAREALEILDEEVRRLPLAYRLPVILCCLEGLSQEEAARQLGCAPGAVKGRLERGRARLRERLARRGLTLPAALGVAGIGQGVSAGVPAALAGATVAFATTSAIPARVAALAECGLNGVAAGKLRAGVALAMAMSVLIATAGVVLHQASPRALPGGEPGAAGRQGPVPAKAPPAHRDAHGDALPAGAVARLGTLRFRHSNAVRGVAYSPDGKLLATAGGADTQVRLWEAATGRLLASVPGARSVAFTPNGHRLYYCGGNHLAEPKFLNVAQLREEDSPVFAVHSSCLALSPDGRCLAVDNRGQVLVRDVTTGKVRLRLTDHEMSVAAVAYSPDGKTIATAADEAVIRLWDSESGKLVHQLQGHKSVAGYRSPWHQTLTVAFSPNSKQLVSGSVDKTVRLWDVATGKETRRLGEHKDGVLCVAFTPDGKQVLTGGWDEPIRLWDAATGREARRFPKRSESASRVAFAPGGKTIAVVPWGYQAPRFWDVESGGEVPSARGPELGVTGVVFSHDGRTLMTAGDGGVLRQWETDLGRELRRWENRPYHLSCLASSPDWQVVAGGDNSGTIYLWQADTGRELRRLKGPKGWVHGLAFAPDGKVLASACDDGKVRLWDVATGAELRSLTGHTRYARAVAFSPDGKTLASAAEDQSVRTWRVDTGEALRRLKTSHLQTQGVAISPDGLLLIAASPGERPIQVWELATGRELPPFAPLPSSMWVYSAVFSPDGRTLAAGGEDGVVRLWEVVSGQERRHFKGHTGWAYRVRFSPDGTRLASASNDTTAVVWDVTTPSADERKLAAGLTGAQAEALWADLAADAERADRAIRVLAAAPGRAVALLGRRLAPAPKVDPERVKQLIAQLDDDRFAERDRAAKELAALDELALPALRAAAGGITSLEHRRRVEKLLKRPSLVSSPEVLRSLRAIEALERVGTPEARRVLASLTHGAPEARLTREAKAAVERLGKRLTEKP